MKQASILALAGAVLSLTACSAEMGSAEEEQVGSVSEALVTNWSANFSDGNGWTDVKYYSTLRLADLNNDGRSDLCGRGGGGINCGLSNGSSFPGVAVWASAFSDANGWGTAPYYSTIRFPQINGAGGKDVCGRGSGGINCATSTGATFGAVTVWQSAFSDVNGWNVEKYYSTIEFPDVSGDGKSDVCGRGGGGINCAVSTGAAFGAASVWNASFSDANLWGSAQYYKTIKYPDVTGDGKADVCGRGAGGVNCAVSTGAAFGAASVWASTYSDANAWNSVQYYSTIQYADLNNDGRADVCGRASTGMLCGLSTGAGFTAPTLWTTSFKDADGWNAVQYYSTIRLVDINNDGRADVCGRGGSGMFCGLSNGASFAAPVLTHNWPSDANGWTAAKNYSTLLFANIDAVDVTPELCGRGFAGMLCE